MKELKYLVRPNIQSLFLSPSKSVGDREKVDCMLDANESPFNAPYNCYSDMLQAEVREKLGRLRGVRPDCIYLANGCNELIDMLYRVFCTPQKDNVVGIEPSYALYARRAAVNDVEFRRASLNEAFNITAENLLRMVNGHTKMIFLCSPNSPTGNLLNREEIIKTLDRFDGIVVVDESYVDYSRSESLLRELPSHPNLVLLNSFSSAWASAGIRLGVAYAIPQIVKYLGIVGLPYQIGRPTCELALEMITRRFDVDRWIKQLLEEREKVITAFKLLPFCRKIHRTDANFFLVQVDDVKRIHRYLLECGIAVQDCSDLPMCADCLRITVGMPQDNNALLGALRKYAEKR